VTDKENFASGVLIRAVCIPNKNERLASGPGLVTKTFGIDISFNSLEVLNNKSLFILFEYLLNKLNCIAINIIKRIGKPNVLKFTQKS